MYVCKLVYSVHVCALPVPPLPFRIDRRLEPGSQQIRVVSCIVCTRVVSRLLGLGDGELAERSHDSVRNRASARLCDR